MSGERELQWRRKNDDDAKWGDWEEVNFGTDGVARNFGEVRGYNMQFRFKPAFEAGFYRDKQDVLDVRYFSREPIRPELWERVKVVPYDE